MILAFAAAVKNIKNAVELMRPKYFDFRMISLFAILAIISTIIIKIDSQNTLDTRFYYTGAEAAKYFKSLSDKDTYRYLITEIFDLSLIATYTTILFLSFKRLFYKNTGIKYLALIPGVFDLFETSTIILVLTEDVSIKSYPWLGIITSLKWGGIAVVTLLYFFGILRVFKKKAV